MMMAMRGILHGKEDKLVKDLKETTLSFRKLGKKYGVSMQAVHNFSKRQGIKRPVKPRGHQTGECRLCQKLIQISNKPHSEFLSIHTIVEETGGSRAKCLSHLRALRSKGLVSQRFGRLRSKRAEEAYAIYFTERLPIRMIGQRAGLKNFHSIIRRHRELGYNVLPSLYVYDRKKRDKI
jgi:biotin operon repressor